MSEKTKEDDKNKISNISSKQMEKDQLIYNKLIYSNDESLFPLKFTYNLIERYINKSEMKKRINNVRMRNIKYFENKIKAGKQNLKCRENNDIKNEKILLQFFISFNKNIWIMLKKYKKEKTNNKKLIYLHDIFQKLITIICFSFISGNIKDDSFELIIKIILDFSLDIVSEKKEKIEELKHMMFFNESIKIIKLVFNYFDEYSDKKKEIMKNIIIHINNNIIGSLETKNLNYSNKYFLCKNDYKTTLLIGLSPIITKMNSTEITDQLINLLTNINLFQFRYDNCMKPTLRLFEPLLINLNKKKIEEIKHELEITDFTIKYLNALNNKEKQILQNEPCMIKQGFYLGNQIGGIHGDINNLENEFLLLFSFKIESSELNDVSIFEIYHEKGTQLKIHLTKNMNNKYELEIEDERGSNSANVQIQINKTYIFIFHIVIKKYIRLLYIRENGCENQSNLKIYNGNQIKLKNFKQDNLKFCIGCQRENQFKNNFIGFIGDFIILNAKHIKENKEKEIFEEILKLKNNYSDIAKLLLNNKNIIIKQKDTYYNNKNNSTFKETNAALSNLADMTEFQSNFSINIIISQKYFKLVEYKDNIDYMNLSNNYYESIEKPFSVKNKYFINYKIKSDSSLYKKCLTLNSSIFNRNFHAFERKFSLIEFIKYKGIHFLSLIFEYYYQIICHLIEIKDKVDENNLSSVCKAINQKIINVLNFFNSNIIKTNLYESNINETKQFLYIMVSLIFKFIEIKDLHINSFKSICEILDSFDKDLHLKVKKEEPIDFLLLMRRKLFELLINPRLFKEKNSENFDKINYVFLFLLTFLKLNEIKYLDKIVSKENFEFLLSYIWLIDKQEEDIKNFEITRKNYISFFVLFLQISHSFKSIEVKKVKSSKNINRDPSNEIITNTNKETQEQYFINKICQKALENRKNQYIFHNLTLIMVKTNGISYLNKSNINKVKNYFLEENKDDELRNTEKKKILYLSYLQILLSFYFSRENSKESKEETFQDFLNNNNLNYDLDLLYSFFGLIREINNFGQLINLEVNSYEKEDLKKIVCYDYPKFTDSPIKELDPSALNDLKVDMIKNIFLYILFFLEELAEKSSKGKNSDKNNTPQNDLEILEKETFDGLKKNIDIIFKYPHTKLCEIIFSGESNICTKLFGIKWKYGELNDIKYIQSAMKKYYKELVKNIHCSFIYKFFLEISFENLQIDSQDENKKYKVLEFKADMLIYMIKTLKELESSKEKISHFLYNLLNLIIVVNNELNYEPNFLFNNKKLCEYLYVLIDLISKKLIFSNYCIEFKEKEGKVINENPGKIISEFLLDLFLALPDKYFNKSIFINTFTRGKKKMTTFFIIDINKEKKKDKNKNNSEFEIMNEYHKILKDDKKIRKKYFTQENKIYKIEETNFTIYFLGKCFVYLRSNLIKEKGEKKDKGNQLKVNQKESALNDLIHILEEDIYNLYTNYRNFFETKTCGFPLYDATKKYFESTVLQNYFRKGSKSTKDVDLYKNFFNNDLIVTLKDEYELKYCFSSRLTIKNIPKESTPVIEEKQNNDIINSRQKSKIFIDNSPINNQSMQDISSTHSDSFKKEPSLNDIEKDLENSDFMSTSNEEIKNVNKKEFIHSFELIKKDLSILNPKNFFLKKIFSDIFKNIVFRNKSFINIKYLYIIKYGNRSGFTKESKQIDYPTRQKNYSNFLEPRIFLRRDFSFFDKIYFPVSFKYLPESFVNKKIEDIFFYNHQFRYKKEKLKKEMIYDCELVTNQYIYFGKIYFFEKYIFFENEDDPRNSPEYDLETFKKYSISTKSKEKKIIKKNKMIVIYYNNIEEAIKRRTLLITQSLEIFLKNGKSFFFNFFWSEEAQRVYKFINDKKEEYNFIFDINYNQKEISNVITNFHNGKMSNYFYLLNLNKYSTRTFCDLSQYPVFPWLVFHHKKLGNKSEYNENDLRDMKYPISMQDKEKRDECIRKYKNEMEENKFQSHFTSHYSSSAFVYYYLMRLNPYGQDLIRLQNYHNENPNRIFLSFESLEAILSGGGDNRELLPDFFCYFDYFLNLNCNYFGEITQTSINDDFEINLEESMKNNFVISPYVYNLYREKKLLNSSLISKNIHNWVDIIFGKKQFFEDKKEAAESCNIFNKLSYEQKINFEKKLKKYIGLLEEKKIEEKKFYAKMRSKFDMAVNFGMAPKQILKATNILEEENNLNNNVEYELKKKFEGKILCFKKLSDDEYIFLKDTTKKEKYKIRTISLYKIKNKNLSENKIYEYKQLNLLKKNKNIEVGFNNENKKIPLYNPCYSFSCIKLKISKKNNKTNDIAILSCRYLGNYFNIQINEKNINIYCEDFVTCIKEHNSSKSDIFYTGLFNGKLIEWEIGSNFEINDIKSIYSHQAPITVIELYNSQNIIITASEDKFIHIRKQYDFELLTSINLIYCFGNPMISRNNNIFPSLIKISDLNLLYVLIYDLEKKKNFIRGYNLNGLFFAQTDYFIIEKNKDIIINNISFTKNSNLIIGFYNTNKFYTLQSWDLKPIFDFRDFKLKDKDKKEREGTEMIEYDFSSDILKILYDNEFILKSSGEKDLKNI